MYDRLTTVAEKVAHSRIIENYILRVKPGYLYSIREEINPILEDVASKLPILERLPRELLNYPSKIIPAFDMLATALPRDIVFDFAEDDRVEAIYHDKPMYVLQYPRVPAEGIFTVPRRVGEITFTTTYYTREAMGLNIAHGKGYWGRDIKVAVVDSGCNRLHEQTRRFRFDSTMYGQVTDFNGHGTWCCSCVAGFEGIDQIMGRYTGKSIRCLGMAPEANLLSVKSLGWGIGVGLTSNILEGVQRSVDFGADIVSMSLGGESKEEKPDEDPYYPVFERLLKMNIIPVVAAGNNGPVNNTITSPGCLPQPLSVGAYDPLSGNLASFSSRGPTNWGDIKPDCIAPGVNIYSAAVGLCDKAEDNRMTGYSPLSGTSMATPHVAGAVALMRETYRRELNAILTVDEIKRMLKATSVEEKNNDVGWGAFTYDRFMVWVETEYNITL